MEGSFDFCPVSDFRLQSKHEVAVLHDGISTGTTNSDLLKLGFYGDEDKLVANGIINFPQLLFPLLKDLNVFDENDVLHELFALLLLNALDFSQSGVDVVVKQAFVG